MCIRDSYNPTRLAQTYDLTRTTALIAKLRALADELNVRGILYPLEEHTGINERYTTWNSAYCDVQAANRLAQAIREDVIAPYLNAEPSIAYIVVIGDDAQIPFYRQKDFARIANEQEFGLIGYAEAAIGAATRQGFYLTDDAYGTPTGAELGWRGQYFWRPRQATGRLVESPEEIAIMIDTFRESGGLLNSNSALVTGYDFLIDSADAIAWWLDVMHAPATASTLIDDTWTAGDLRAEWTQPANAPDLVAVNAHFEHWAALPASATTTADLFFNTDIVNADASITGGIAWSMGCHAGYNVPDAAVPPYYPQTMPDFPQALAAKGGTWIANTGYGYGTDDGIAGSERLMVYVTQEMGRHAAMPIGMALRNAKVRYLYGLPHGGLTPYDAKSIIQATLYGLPMYAVAVPNPLNPLAYVPPISVTQVVTMSLDFNLLAQRLNVKPDLYRQDGKTGDFFSIGEQDALWTHGTTGRPLLPTGAVPLPPPPETGWRPQGVALLAAALESFDDVDLIITRPVTDTALPAPPLQEGLGWSSPQLFAINHFDDDLSRLSATFALFNARSGELRLLREVEVEIFYTRPWNTDHTPPRILTARALRITDSDGLKLGANAANAGDVELEATAIDSEGAVKQFYFTFITPERIWSVPLEPDYNDPSGQRWLGSTSDIPANARYVLQAVDEAGNVAMAMNKGDYIPLNSEIRFVYLPVVLRNANSGTTR